MVSDTEVERRRLLMIVRADIARRLGVSLAQLERDRIGEDRWSLSDLRRRAVEIEEGWRKAGRADLPWSVRHPVLRNVVLVIGSAVIVATSGVGGVVIGHWLTRLF